MNFKDYLYYDGECLRYKVRCGHMMPHSKASCKLNGKGYAQFQLKGKTHRYHRVVWEVCNGPIPEGMQIDHIDRDKTNNRLENLRLATSFVNAQNRRMHSSNSSGIPNVRWDKVQGKWYVAVANKYRGRFKRLEDAAAEAIYWHVHLNYHINHGSM